MTGEGSNNLGISAKSTNATRGGIRKFEKFALMRKASSILFDPDKPAHEQHRTCWCHRGILSAGGHAGIQRQTSGGSARLTGVTTCGSVWACPVCSARVCAIRQAELSEAMQAWINQGGYVWLMTLTFPHEYGMVLRELLEKFTRAKDHFKNSRTYKRIFSKEKRKGSVTSLEVTLGEANGWHPHQHDLVFASPDTLGETIELEHGRLESAAILELKEAWCTALMKAGLCDRHQVSDVMAHGLDIRGGQYAAEYISKFGREQKWGLSREIAMHAAKVGTDNKGAHPFQILAWAQAGDGLAVEQFREYAEVFKTKHMLSWSKGLKKALTGLDEISDEQAAVKDLPDEQTVGRIDAEGLSIIQSRRLLDNFLKFVADHCHDPTTAQQHIDEYLTLAKELHPRTARGDIKVKMWSRGYMHVDSERVGQ